MLALRPTPATGTYPAVVRSTARVRVVLPETAGPIPGWVRVAWPRARWAAARWAPAVGALVGRRVDPRALAGQAAHIGAGRLLGAVSTTLALRSGLGNGPWDTLVAATHHAGGVSVGTLNVLVSAGFATAAWRLGARPNPALLATHAMIGGLAVDWLLPRVPEAATFGLACAYSTAALAAGVGGSLAVMGAPAARTAYDHLLAGVVARRGWGLRRARWALDLPALGAGWALGGAIGPGTVACALLVGPLAHAARQRRAARAGAAR